MNKVLLLASLLLAATAWAGDNPSLPGVHQVMSTGPDGQAQLKYILVPGAGQAPRVISQAPALPREALRTLPVLSPRQVLSKVPLAGQLWVDRNHLLAVAGNVSITGDGQYIQAGWWLNHRRVSNYLTAGGPTPVWVASQDSAQWMISVGSSYSGNTLAASEASLPAQAWSKDSPVPKWTYNYPPGMAPATGEAVSKDDSKAAFVGARDSAATLYVFNAQTGETLYTRSFGAPHGLAGIGGGGQNSLDLSADGSVVCASGYDTIVVWRSGVRAAAIYNYSQCQAKLSGDGNRLVMGGFSGNLSTFEWNGSSYALHWTANTSEPWVDAVAISADGSTVSAITGHDSGRAYAYDWSSSTALWTYGNFGGSGALGTYAAISASGGYLIFTSFGATDTSGTFDVCAVFQRASGTPIFEITRNQERGSLYSCAISDSGTFATAGGKAVHAYQGGNGGEVYAIQVRDVGVEEQTPSGVPLGFSLSQNAPNPWVSGTRISYALPRKTRVALRVYNPNGQLVRTLAGGDESPGCKQVAWDGRDDSGIRVSSGIYFYRLQAGSFADTRKMVIVK